MGLLNQSYYALKCSGRLATAPGELLGAACTELLLGRDGARHPPTLPTEEKHFSYSLAKAFIMPKGLELVNLGSDQDFAV